MLLANHLVYQEAIATQALQEVVIHLELVNMYLLDLLHQIIITILLEAIHLHLLQHHQEVYTPSTPRSYDSPRSYTPSGGGSYGGGGGSYGGGGGGGRSGGGGGRR